MGVFVGAGVGSARAVSGSIALDGTPVTVSLTSAGANGHYTFAGATGQRVFVELTGSTFDPACPAVGLSLIRPDKSKFAPTVTTCGASAVLDTRTLDQQGTWAVLVDPKHSNVGTATLRAWSVPPDQAAPITLDDVATAVNLGTPGQNGAFTFTPTVGQSVAVEVSNASFTGACPPVVVALLRPDATQAATANVCSESAFIEATPIDQAGTWTVRVDPQSDSEGSLDLQVFDATEQQGTAMLDGTPLSVALSEPGQNGAFTFTGTVGQKISATVASATFPGCAAYTLALVRPDGSTLGSPADECGASAFLDGQVLDQTGSWRIVVDPQGTATGTAQLSVFDATDQVRGIKLDGTAVSANLLAPGQNSLLQFAGDAGTAITAKITGATFSGPCPTFAVSLVRPDGTTLGAPVTSCSDTAELVAQTLDQSGSWSLLVDAQGPATGSATVQAFVSSDDVRAISLNGARLKFDLNAMQNGDFTFAGTAGQKVSAAISNAVFTGCPGYTLALERPDASFLGTPVNGCDADAFLDAVKLDQTGTWTFVVHPVVGAVSGSIQAYTFTDLTAPADLSGKSLKLVFQHPGQNATVTFHGTPGQKISAVLSGSTVTGGGCPALAMTLIRPGGAATVVAGPITTCTDTAFLDSIRLDKVGTWRLIIDPQRANKGTLTAQVFTVDDDVRAITPGLLRSFTAQQPGANGVFHFKGSSGQVRHLTVQSSMFSGCPGVVVSFVRPNGSVLASVDGCDPDFVLGPVTLDATGQWKVFIDPQGPGEGTMIFELTS